MIIQIANIIAGFLLAAPKIKTWVPKSAEHVATAETRLSAFRSVIGIIALVLGLAGLIERLGIFYFGIDSFGASLPQAIPALLSGLLLARDTFDKFPVVTNFIKNLEPYAAWIGVFAIFAGLGSLLFGCIAPFCYPLTYF